MPQPSVFDPPAGVVKADGQSYHTGTGNQMIPGGQPTAPPPQAAPQPGAIQQLIAALASAFAPKSITQAPQRMKQQEAEAEGKDDLGSKF